MLQAMAVGKGTACTVLTLSSVRRHLAQLGEPTPTAWVLGGDLLAS